MKEVTEGRIEGKRGRGNPCIMFFDDIKTDDTYEMIKCRALNSESWVPGTCFRTKHQS